MKAWSHGDIELDTFEDGEQIIYCYACDQELREAEIVKA